MTTPALPPAPDEAVRRFLAELSHELRTPLSAIIGFAEAMAGRAFGDLSETYAEHAALICAAGRHLLDLTDDLADLAGASSGRLELAPEGFDATPAIGEDVRLMSGEAGRRGVDLTAALPSQPLMVMADRRRLRQIVLNLVANALKATPAGGAVAVTAAAGDAELVLAVADTGAGMTAGEPRQPAVRAGLGLALVRAFSEAHGGTVEIESAPGVGTTVRVHLPVLI